MANLLIYANHSNTDSPLNTSGVDWIEIDPDNDRIIISEGSDTVKDGEPSPGESALNSAGIVLDGSEQTYDKYFLDDASAVLLKEIFLMGEGNYRYVMAFDFDDSTVSEPVLEIWDDSDMDSIDSVVLGAGDANSSWIRGIVTTDSLPGASWTGSRLAGSSDGHFLWLNDLNGALTVAKTLYCQLKVVVPATQVDAGATTPVLVCKYTTV